MNTKLFINDIPIDIQVVRFSDGATNVKIDTRVDPGRWDGNNYEIVIDPSDPADTQLWNIMLVKDAIERTYPNLFFDSRRLKIPYLPHGRADRAFENGNPVPLEIFIDAINRMGFTDVKILDPHNFDFLSKIKKSLNGTRYHLIPQHTLLYPLVSGEVERIIKSFGSEGIIFVSPDKGSRKKISRFGDLFSEDIVILDVVKTRDLETGRVTEIRIMDLCFYDLKGKDLYIFDDIIDGGGTFIHIAEQLKAAGANSVTLVATHGIFSKGLEPMRVIDRIFVHHIVGTYVTREQLESFNNPQLR